MCSTKETYMMVHMEFETTPFEVRIPEEESSMSSLSGAAKAKADSGDVCF